MPLPLKFDPQILNEAKAIANMLETFDNEDIEKQTEDTEMEKV